MIQNMESFLLLSRYINSGYQGKTGWNIGRNHVISNHHVYSFAVEKGRLTKQGLFELAASASANDDVVMLLSDCLENFRPVVGLIHQDDCRNIWTCELFGVARPCCPRRRGTQIQRSCPHLSAKFGL